MWREWGVYLDCGLNGYLPFLEAVRGENDDGFV